MPNTLHMPNGQTITVSTVFGGLYFKANDLNTHGGALPPGWTIIIHAEEEEDVADDIDDDEGRPKRESYIHRYKKPTLHNDALFISSISNPSSSDFKPAVSPTRQIAMMLWTTLWWYFHQPRPEPQVASSTSSKTPEPGKPKGEWRIKIKREGVFKGRHLLPKLERMGLIASEDSCVGADEDGKDAHSWINMFVSQRSFWQLDARIYLFTLSPTGSSPFPAGSPYSSRPSSRPASPNRGDTGIKSPRLTEEHATYGLWSPTTASPFHSTSHIPTYYPPPPPQYIFTNGVRHPIRPKPPRQGETFYTRFVPSVGQYLTFRVASLSNKCVVHTGPTGASSEGRPNSLTAFLPPNSSLSGVMSNAMSTMSLSPCDSELMHSWMNDPRVDSAWGVSGPRHIQEQFLKNGLNARHSIPVIGCWDGKPFGYFEIYWVKEDPLGKLTDCGDWDRGIHVLVGEQEFRGEQRVKIWLSALVHYCWLADSRTDRVLSEPRVDNEKFINYLQKVGFYKQKEVTFPHKQSALMKIQRDAWESPFL